MRGGEVSPEAFEPHRDRLLGIAYRMLGSVASAEDVVQETWVRWSDAGDVVHPAAWLSTVCTRLCLDEARSARARREQYVGPWLPEPWVEDVPPPSGLLGESLTMAFLLLLQRLTAPQRAAWLLREVFEHDYAHVAEVLETSEANCRQLVRRAKAAIDGGRTKFTSSTEESMALLAVFQQAVVAGDVATLERYLADDAVFVGDGAGRKGAARNVVRGANRVARMLVGLQRKGAAGARVRVAWVNGALGVLAFRDGTPLAAMAVEVSDGQIRAVHNVSSPAKLAHLTPRS